MGEDSLVASWIPPPLPFPVRKDLKLGSALEELNGLNFPPCLDKAVGAGVDSSFLGRVLELVSRRVSMLSGSCIGVCTWWNHVQVT